MIIVGSQAAKYWEFSNRTPADFDCWILENEVVNPKYDTYVVTQEIYDMVPTMSNYATADALYTIKCSHFSWDIHWQKTKLDIIHMKFQGCKLLPDLYAALKAIWIKDYHDKEFLSLKQDKAEFFTDRIVYKYDHDYLHELVAFPNNPVYTKCLKTNEDVLVDKEKFANMSFDNQVRMFREEITVIACERWVLNDKNPVSSWYEAYSLSLKKVIISLTKGWATDFIIHNLANFIKPDYSYFENILKTLEYNMSVDLTIFEQVKEISQYDESLEEMVYQMCEGDFSPDFGLYDTLIIDQKMKQFEYEHIDQDGGGEGGSEQCYGVFTVYGKMYKAEYSYYSHHGHDTDDILATLREVKPVEKTVVFYE